MTSLHRDPQRAADLAEVLKAVAHPLRLRIVACLSEAEAHVTALARQLEAPEATVSQQLRILRMHHLVEARRKNGFAFYRLREPSLEDLVGCMERCSRR